MDYFAMLNALHIDADVLLERFCGNTALPESFFRKLPQEPTMPSLTRAMDAHDWETAENSAHTLKGIAANLELTCLRDACAALVDTLRAGQTDKAVLCYQAVEAEYGRICGILQT